jgi:hypothetical protein
MCWTAVITSSYTAVLAIPYSNAARLERPPNHIHVIDYLIWKGSAAVRCYGKNQHSRNLQPAVWWQLCGRSATTLCPHIALSEPVRSLRRPCKQPSPLSGSPTCSTNIFGSFVALSNTQHNLVSPSHRPIGYLRFSPPLLACLYTSLWGVSSSYGHHHLFLSFGNPQTKATSHSYQNQPRPVRRLHEQL